MAKTLNQDIYAELKRRIVEEEYTVNDVLTERSIAAEFNVSKTPVRESLSLLAKEGYVTRYPNFGYMVKELSYGEAMSICELRCILETAACRIIVKYASDDEIKRLYEFINTEEESSSIGKGSNTTFHWEVSKLAGNTYLSDLVKQFAMLSQRPAAGEYNRGLNEQIHKQIVDALLARDAEAAERYLKQDVMPKGQREI